jgi:hypothetical protein
MAELEILNVERTELDVKRFQGGWIDWPAKGDCDAQYGFKLAGWVLSRDGSQPEIDVLDEGETIATLLANRARPDVATFVSDESSMNCGFMGVVSAATLASNFKLQIYVAGGGGRHLFATISGKRSPLITDATVGVQPAMITTLGRTGSTWLLLLLAQHPELIVHPPLPFETQMVSYWSKVFAGLSSPKSYLRSLVAYDEPLEIDPGEEFAVRVSIDQDDAARWLGSASIESLARFGRDQVQSFYRASMESQQKPMARYFLEKQLPQARLRRIQREWFPGTKEIFLVRDPRDMMASIFAFNEKRGHESFRAGLFKGAEYVAGIRASVEALWYALQSAENALLVRYEDLVCRPVGTLQGIVSFLGLSAGEAMIEEMITKSESVEPSRQKQHQTSADPPSSIGRWRSDLSKDLLTSANSEFAQMIKAFGYEETEA